MVYLYVITLLAVIAYVSASTTSGNDSSDTCFSTSSFKFIKQGLANISNQLDVLSLYGYPTKNFLILNQNNLIKKINRVKIKEFIQLCQCYGIYLL